MTIKHDLTHEVYIDPKDDKQHIKHGMLEYKKSELEEVHADYEVYHKDDVVEPNDGRINDWHIRHEDKHLEIYCDNHPDAFECRVYDDQDSLISVTNPLHRGYFFANIIVGKQNCHPQPNIALEHLVQPRTVFVSRIQLSPYPYGKTFYRTNARRDTGTS